jgi:hypothetical protein
MNPVMLKPRGEYAIVAGGLPPPTIDDPGRSVSVLEIVGFVIVDPVMVPPMKLELLIVTLLSVPPLIVGLIKMGFISVMFVSDPPVTVSPVNVALVASNTPLKAAPGPAVSVPTIWASINLVIVKTTNLSAIFLTTAQAARDVLAEAEDYSNRRRMRSIWIVRCAWR